MKRFLALTLAILMVLCMFASCGGSTAKDDDNHNDVVNQTQKDDGVSNDSQNGDNNQNLDSNQGENDGKVENNDQIGDKDQNENNDQAENNDQNENNENNDQNGNGDQGSGTEDEEDNGAVDCVHTDTDRNHLCDICSDKLTNCVDTNKDHKCEYCQQVFTDCIDSNNDHNCDSCGERISQHTYKNSYCTICGIHIDIWDGASADSFESGNGSEISPYVIKNAAQLAYLATQVNAGTTYDGVYFKLDSNINLCGISWTPIGNETNSFKGIFDGANNEIYNFELIGSDKYIGLFGYNAGVVKNLGIEGLNVDVTPTTGYIGGLVAYNAGTVSNCYANGKLTSLSDTIYMGCLVGYNNGGAITDCYALGEIEGISGGTGKGYIGGLLGYNNTDGNVSNSYAKVTVSGSSATSITLGGFLGYNKGTVTNCCATESISGTSPKKVYAGGFAGYNNGGTITACYATGDVTSVVTSSDTGTTYCFAGGLCAYLDGGTIARCYATGNVSSSTSSNLSSGYIYSYAGGLVAYNMDLITNSYATGNVNASSSKSNSSVYEYAYAGGLVGYNDYQSSSEYSKITNCYATGDVFGKKYAGGLLGSNTYYAEVNNCYATGNITGSNSLGCVIGHNAGTKTNSYSCKEQTLSGKANTSSDAKELSEIKTRTFLLSVMSWSVNDWTFTEGEHPIPENVGPTILK